MKHIITTMLLLCAVTNGGIATAQLGTAPSVPSVADKATHQHSSVVKMEAGAPTINAFCLNAKGQIVAACGTGPGELRVMNDNGEVVAKWATEVMPEAVSVRSDQSILVAGEGRVYHYSPAGKLLASSSSPHAERLKSDDKQLRQAAIASLKRTASRVSLKSRISAYESIIKRLEERAEETELTAAEKQMLQRLPDTLAIYKQQLAGTDDSKTDGGPSEKDIKRQVDILIKSKMRISSICSSDDAVFVTTRALTGYGYDIWKTDTNLAGGQIIVEGLRGCCGQMDVQCCDKGLFVAENSADRVVHYDFDGKEISHWGKSDRTGIDGFGSCCNPMNVCFDQDGFVYTAEASLGRIKKFDTSGKLIDYVGDVDLVPGCKNVSIAVSPMNGNIYMLDLTRNHIVMMQPKSDAPKGRTAALNDKAGSNE